MMAKCRIGHFAEAQILQSLEIDYIDESEVLTPADLEHHVDKWQFTVPSSRGLHEPRQALRRIAEGAAMIGRKARRHRRYRQRGHAHALGLRRHPPASVAAWRGDLLGGQEPASAVRARPMGRGERPPPVYVHGGGSRRPPTRRSACSSAPDGVFVGSASSSRATRRSALSAIVEATTHYLDAEVSRASRPASASRWSGSRRRHSTRPAPRNARLVDRLGPVRAKKTSTCAVSVPRRRASGELLPRLFRPVTFEVERDARVEHSQVGQR